MPQERHVREQKTPPRESQTQENTSLCDEAVAMDALEAADSEIVVNDTPEEQPSTFVTLHRDSQTETDADNGIPNDTPHKPQTNGSPTLTSGITLEEANSTLEKLLNLDTSLIKNQSVPFLRMDGVVETLIGFITRLPPDEKTFAETGRQFAERWPDITPRSVFRRRDESNSEKLIRSYRVMEIVCNTAPTNAKAFDHKATNIAISLFGAFHPFSDANFHHVRKVMEFIVRWHGEPVMDLYLYRHSEQSCFPLVRPPTTDADGIRSPPLPPIFAMIPYLHDPTVGCIMISLLFAPAERMVQKAKRKQRLAYLQQNEFLETLIGNLDNVDTPLLISGTAEFVSRMVEEAWRVDESLALFMSAVGDPQITRRLVDIIVGGTDEQKDAGIRVLHALLVQGTGKDFRRLNLNLTPAALKETLHASTESSPLNDLSASIRRFLSEHITRLCEALLINNDDLRDMEEVKFSSYVVQEPFRNNRLYLLECIYQGLRGSEKLDDALSNISGNLWKTLVNWFFQYPYNNCYHSLFYKIFYTVLTANHRQALKSLVTKNQLVKKLVDQYSSEAVTGNRGYILLICNTIRLAGESQKKSDYIPQMLETHMLWKEFLPTLEQDTGRQLGVFRKDTIRFKKPVSYHGPLRKPEYVKLVSAAPIQVPERASEWESTDGDLEEDVRERTRRPIGLGSQYADALGFVVERKIPAGLWKKKDLETGWDDPDSIQIPITYPLSSFGGFIEGGGGGKKKKKKKKKRKNESSIESEERLRLELEGVRLEDAENVHVQDGIDFGSVSLEEGEEEEDVEGKEEDDQ